MSIAIFSGTFDPIHEGHILLGTVVCEQFGIDKVLFLPEPVPRRKQEVTPLEDRERMVSIATADDPRLELFRTPPGAPHTIEDTLLTVAEAYPDEEFFMVVGSDVFKHVGTWGQRDDEKGSAQDVAGSIAWIVAVREGDDAEELMQLAEELGLQARFIPSPLPKISSRLIRAALAQGSEHARGLNDTVYAFIRIRGLYGAE